MKHWVRRAVFRNLTLKIVSLALALLLFVVVHSEKHSLAQGTVELTFSLPPGKLLAIKPPAVLRVGVTGPVSRVQRFRFEDLSPVSVDLAGAQNGFFKFPESLFTLPVGLKVAYIRPDGFQLRFEATVEREVPVRIKLEGEPAPGYGLIGRQVRPSRVTIRGPRSVVTSVVYVATDPVSLEGVVGSRTETVPLALPPQLAEAKPTSVQVALEIARVSRGHRTAPERPPKEAGAGERDQ
jgi:YbbR domain-containing protein